MLNYEECKAIAMNRASNYGVTVTKAYTLKEAYVFDTKEECDGIMPVVINPETEEVSGIWNYLNKYDLTMGDMVEKEL